MLLNGGDPMNIGGMRISKKFAALLGGIAMCEYLRQTGQTLEDVQPIMLMVMTYLGVQGLEDVTKSWKGTK